MDPGTRSHRKPEPCRARRRQPGLPDSRQGSEKGFRKKKSRKAGLRIPARKRNFVCPWEGCGYAGVKSNFLTKHLRVHTGEKPFACSYEGCGRSFAQSGSLTRHLRLHTGEKPFVCTHKGCEQAFTQPGALIYHVRAAHSGDKPFVCPHEGCQQAFIQSSALTTHWRAAHAAKKKLCLSSSRLCTVVYTIKRSGKSLAFSPRSNTLFLFS